MKFAKNLKNKKGFTLVEVIIVLVILAILAAVLIPSLVGYIDKANEKTSIAECRSFVLAAQTIASETYGEKGTLSGNSSDSNYLNPDDYLKEAFELAELNGGTGSSGTSQNYFADVEMTAKGEIIKVDFYSKKDQYLVEYTGGNYVVSQNTAGISDNVTIQ